jgi:hypothetical protein
MSGVRGEDGGRGKAPTISCFGGPVDVVSAHVQRYDAITVHVENGVEVALVLVQRETPLPGIGWYHVMSRFGRDVLKVLGNGYAADWGREATVRGTAGEAYFRRVGARMEISRFEGQVELFLL